MNTLIVISVSGPFQVRDASGTDITPSSMKAQGLLLLLALSPSRSRSRRWLQDKLWSDRGPEQGSGSLRQVLTQLRKTLGAASDVLCADRQKIWLDDDMVEIEERSYGELAEGIDVRDPEFEDWLALERSRFEDALDRSSLPFSRESERDEDGDKARGGAVSTPQAESPSRAVVNVVLSETRTDDQAWAQSIFVDTVLRSLRETYSADLIYDADRAPREANLALLIESRPLGDGAVGFRAELSEGVGRFVRWSDHCSIRAPVNVSADDPNFALLACEISEAYGDMISRATAEAPLHSDILCRIGIQRLFTMRRENAALACELFERALRSRPRGLYHAWLAQARTIQRIERHESDTDALRESGRRSCEDAILMEPRNSQVLALVANTHLFLLGETAASLEFAKRSISINPANPMAWWALSAARLYCGDAAKAYEEAKFGRYLASRSPFRFWWDLQQFSVAMMLGKTEEALGLLEACAGQNASFRPPLRYLAALRATEEDEEGAMHAIGQLITLEPDFTVARMIGDRDYPASLLHRAEAVDLGKVSSVLA